MNSQPQRYTFRQVLATGDVRRLWVAQLASIAGDFLAIFAVLSIVSFRLHGSPVQVIGVTLSYMLPLAVFGPFAGVLVDRANPRRVMIASDIARAGLACLLILSRGLAEIYAILFFISTVSTFFIPAQSVLIRRVTPRPGLLAVNAMMQQAMLAVRIASPAAAGLLVARFGPGSCFGLDVVSFLFSAVMLRGIRLPGGSPQPERRTSRTAELLAGARFIAGHSDIGFVVTAMAAATFAISCFSPLVAVFVRDILRSDVRVFGAISAATGLGMIAGTQGARRSGRCFVVYSLGAISCGIALMGSATGGVEMTIGAFVMGGGVGLLMAPTQTLIQSETPRPLLGRVSSTVMSLVSVAQILGLVLSSVLAGAIGLRPLFFLSAALLGGLACAGYGKLRQKRARFEAAVGETLAAGASLGEASEEQW